MFEEEYILYRLVHPHPSLSNYPPLWIPILQHQLKMTLMIVKSFLF